jgi:phytol kinase
VLTLAIALIWLRFNDYLAHKGWVSSPLSRKVIHIGTGPIFVLCWLFFNDAKIAPYLAAIIPLGITLQFALVGFGVIRDPAAVDAMSRTGDRREILRGPLFYGIVFVLLTTIFWRYSPTGLVALMILCGGDGMADIIGKQFGKHSLPWAPNKTFAGSITMFLGGFIFAILVLWVFILKGYFPGVIVDYLIPVSIVAIGSAIVETLPFADIDNLTVPLTSVLLGLVLF